MAYKKRYYKRPGQKRQKKKGSDSRKGFSKNPRVDPNLKNIFSRIGVPERTEFIPDPFQLEALEKLKTSDVLVSAPTGAGKTWIASEAISDYLSRGLITWYASPLKALSNSIYQEFCREFGNENCGILTGDRKENPNAPVIIGTTEILRNQLYDAMNSGTTIQADLVILDEAHYLSNPERGVVWEETLIYLPSRVRLMLLSATISNAEEICSWLKGNRGKAAQVVRSRKRPVPLEGLFLFPDGLISSLGGRKGLTPGIKKFSSLKDRRTRYLVRARPDFGELVSCLEKFNLLPAIFFLKSRSDCDRALFSCSPIKRPSEIKAKVRREVRSFLKKYPHLEGHRQMDALINHGVVSHHAGQLPYWKVLVERMMNRGYLKAIFSTSTVAAGVNFPARTVVLVQSDRFDGREFSDLTATDLHQMTGRAGRRGKDNVGFALVIPGIHQDPQLIYDLKDSKPDPVMSQIHINFSMTLNLLLSHSPKEVKELLNRSFASFQERETGSKIVKRWEEVLKDLKRLLPDAECDIGDPYEILDLINRRAELKRDAKRASNIFRKQMLRDSMKVFLTPGRFILHRNKNIYLIVYSEQVKGRVIIGGVDVNRANDSRKKKHRLKRIDQGQVWKLFENKINLPDDLSLKNIISILRNLPVHDLKPLNVDQSDTYDGKDGSDELELTRNKIRELPCEQCVNRTICHRSYGGSQDAPKGERLKKIFKEVRSLSERMQGMGGGLWGSFKRHLRFLKDTGFVSEDDQLTLDGIWASKLRLDHPLLIADAIRKGSFDEISPETMAGCIAPFVWDRKQDQDMNIQSPVNLKECEKTFNRIIRTIDEIRLFKDKKGFENPMIFFWPAAALYLWAKGVPWEQLIHFIPIAEGDMAALIVRTADHLRQVINLEESHPQLVSAAREALVLILREPVYL